MADTALDAIIVAGGPAASLGYIEEASFGKTPPSPSLKAFRRASTTLSLAKEMYSSNEVRSDRQVSDNRHGVTRANGEVNIDLSPKSHRDWYEALLGGYWQTPAAIPIDSVNLTATLSATTDLLEITATSFDFVAAEMFIGAPVTFTGADAALNGKKFTVVSHDDNKVVLMPPAGFTLAGSPVSLTTGTFHLKGARLSMGAIMRSFTLERAHSDIGKFQVFNGMLAASFSAELPPTGVATGSFSLMGRGGSGYAASSIDGVAEVALDDTDMTSLTFDGAAGTITRESGSWITDGFVPGDKVQFSGDGITDVQNRQQRTVTAVTATVLTVEEAILSGTYTSDYYVLKVGVPSYTEVSDEDVLVAVSGALLINGEPAGVVTGMNFSVDNQMDGSPVVGSNTIPFYSWGNQCQVSVNPTVLFGRGGAGEVMINAAIEENDVSVVLNLDTKDGLDGLAFVFNRAMFAPGQVSDAATGGLPVSMTGTAAKPLTENPEHGTSQIYIYDTTFTGVQPPSSALNLEYVSQAAGVATLRVTGGVAPYFLDADNGGGTSDMVIPVAGEFEFDFVSNATYDPVITDSSTPAKSDTVQVVITTAP